MHTVSLLDRDSSYTETTLIEAEPAMNADLDPDQETTPKERKQELGYKIVGYKIVGDNLDKTVKARYMRDGARNQSLHYFHFFGVKNRVDLSNVPDVHPQTCMPSPELKSVMLLPSAEDDKELHRLFAVHVSRVLATHVPYFKLAFDDVVEWHIKHKYYSEMSMASEVVSPFCPKGAFIIKFFFTQRYPLVLSQKMRTRVMTW